MRSKRLSNFELMRIVSMFLIVIWHVIMHGKMFANTSSESIKNILKLIQYIIIIHVNSFVLLSGYFQSKSKFRIGKFLDLIMEVLFYLTLILIVGNFIGLPIYCTNFVRLYNYYLSCIDGYWFINCYLIVYIFSDYINKFISSLNYKEYKKFLIIGFVIFSIVPFLCGGKILNNIGYNFYSFIYLYILGAFLRIYPINECKKLKNISNIWYFIILICIFFSCPLIRYFILFLVFNFKNINFVNDLYIKISYSSLSYFSPLVIVQSLCYFEFFRNLKFKSKFVNFISRYVFGVYLLHENVYIRGFIYKFLKIDVFYGTSFKHVLYCFVCAIMIFLFCIFVDIFRKAIFDFFKKHKQMFAKVLTVKKM